MTRARVLRLALALLVSAALLWLLLRKVDGKELLAVLAAVSWPWVCAALAALVAGYALRIRRWQSMLRNENPGILWRQCAGPLLAGFAVNNVLPFRAGDVLRCVGFGGVLQVSGGGATATLFVERLLDALMLLIALSFALLLFEIEGSRFFAVGGFALMLVATGMLAVLLFPQLLAPLLRAVTALLARALPRVAERLRFEVDRALGLLAATARREALAPLLGWSVLVWLAEGGVFYCIARALPSLDSPLFAWLALPVATLATLLPGTPGHLGTFDFFAAEAMRSGDNTALSAAAFALLVHATLWLPVTVAGGAWLWGRAR